MSITQKRGRPILFAVMLFVSIILIGAVGYSLIEGWHIIDSLYMAVITVTTVGFGETHPLSQVGRLFTICLTLFGVASFTYAATTLANYVIAGEMRGYLEHRRMQKQIDHLENHLIVCGFGRVGAQVADELRLEGTQVVVIDENPDNAQTASDDGFAVIEGDAGDDDRLREAGVHRARGLIATAGEDADNLMIVLTARALNPRLFIVARANDVTTEKKLKTAGADRVLLLYTLGGRRLAQMAVRPKVMEFIDIMQLNRELQLLLEDVAIAEGSQLAGTTIGNSQVRQKSGANIVAVRHRNGELNIAPAGETQLAVGDVLMAFGSPVQLANLKQMAVSN